MVNTFKEYGMSNKFSLGKSQPENVNGGEMRRANGKSFPALKGLSLQLLSLPSGEIRAPHTHPSVAQMDLVTSGTGKVGIGDSIYEVEKGDLTFIPAGHVHWIENTGNEPLEFVLVLADESAETIELSDMVAGLPDSIRAKAGIK